MEHIAIKIESDQPATEFDQIDTLQWKYRLQFPQNYVEFLLRNNGGMPEADCFEFADGSDASVVDRFLSVGGPSYADLDWHLEIYNGRIPKEFFPIAKDPGGGLIVMGWDGSFKEQIFFWDHEFEADHDGEATMSNMHFIAPDLSHFMENLSVLELE